ncbi:hypothetical protein A3G48_02315 [Candidatus Nomurabacteria bacterium RIFCSPLOWO2_12_FULL_40_42]|uniref:Uncharacterized protein n=1 Tax=Candidatus Nomurabacteria bacterium RIFCSPLOWO2_02_FULL_40_67 TaxID=1801787 RepID=A0A1F6Y3U5_9BACT|nr:MAG: hypothetical protein A2W12_00445 [Candidatus Nomurabacteria bacterium RBG_16_40_11]OGI72861.1 MAG: hypothetical protein A2W56_02025 [Candidatus Nomurabacteria bacterium RIFCSPHIGHO2_02_41_18]OGI78297.1 MAG: hypothetical protein A3C65_01400 [Candidatus Nomurabacteria bacterium RIFCSPHIGHO2_02_FULL_41_150]OGI81201.1 MAG: hypothetical protein A3E03_00685 [Candidatus Nomurabacteria bacterium RIFCSPHIGHO2_12_FULL_40_64]OGI90818.1 MAG: hypothetical protein A3A06_00065 [Candidatus Nomurabacter
MDYVSSFRNYIFLRQKVCDVFKSLVAFHIQLKRLLDDFRFLSINNDTFYPRIIYVSDRSKRWVFSVSNFLAKSTLCIFGKRIHIVFALPESHVEHKFPLTSVITPKSRKFQARKFSRVEEINHPTSVHRIAGETIGVPCEDVSADFFNLI